MAKQTNTTQNAAAQGNGIAVGAGGSLSAPSNTASGNGIALTNSHLHLGGAEVGSNTRGNVTITTADPEIATAALGVANTAFQGGQALAASALQQITAHQTEALHELTPLAESQQTDGESNRNKYVVMVVVALVIGWIFTRKKA
jgi:hypothetical protein